MTLLDSVHCRRLLPPAPEVQTAAPAYESRTRSLLDDKLGDLVLARESTYSRPLSYLGFTKESIVVEGQVQRVAPRLAFGGLHLADPETQWVADLARRSLQGLFWGLLAAAAVCALGVAALARARRAGYVAMWRSVQARWTCSACPNRRCAPCVAAASGWSFRSRARA